MSGDEDDFTGEEWGHIPSNCIRFNLPYRRLCQKCFSMARLIKQETDLYDQTGEISLHRTLESTLKMYRAQNNQLSWEQFKKTADLLAEMHRNAKSRIQRVFASSYLSGAYSFSKEFIYQLGNGIQSNLSDGDGEFFPEELLHPLLCRNSDPPRGTFKRKHQILRVAHRRSVTSSLASPPAGMAASHRRSPVADETKTKRARGFKSVSTSSKVPDSLSLQPDVSNSETSSSCSSEDCSCSCSCSSSSSSSDQEIN